MSQSNIGLNSHQAIKMQKSLPSQAEVFRWMSAFLAEKLNQAAQSEDWARVKAISTIIKVVVDSMKEVEE